MCLGRIHVVHLKDFLLGFRRILLCPWVETCFPTNSEGINALLVGCSWTTLRVRQSGTTQVVHPTLECRPQAPAVAGSTRGAALQRTIVLCTLGKAHGTSQEHWTRDKFVVDSAYFLAEPTVALPEGWRPKLTPRSAQVYGWMCHRSLSDPIASGTENWTFPEANPWTHPSLLPTPTSGNGFSPSGFFRRENKLETNSFCHKPYSKPLPHPITLWKLRWNVVENQGLLMLL